MTYKSKKTILISLIAAAFAFAAAGLAVPDGSMALRICALLAIVCAIAAFIVYNLASKCPHCGTNLYAGVYYLKTCPRCKKSLTAPVEKTNEEERKL